MTPNKEALALAERTVKVLCPNMDAANIERLTNELATEITRLMQPRAQSGGEVEAALKRIGTRLTKSYLGQEAGFPMIDAMRRDGEDIKTLRDALPGRWMPISEAPRDGSFLCRIKSKPHITFEAFIDKESESWEMPEVYEILCNETYPDDILDDSWETYEWQPLPTPPADGENV